MRKRVDALGPFADSFVATHIPQCPCPHCEISSATPGDPEWIEDPDTAQLRGHEAWEPTWIRGRFHLRFTCGACSGITQALGTYDVIEDEPDNWNAPMDHVQRMNVATLYPPLALVSAPLGTPDDVKVLLEQASSAWPGLPSAVANLLRHAVEAVLTHQDVPTEEPGRSRRFSLHERLRRFAESDSKAADPLLAVKWIGNEGSHSSSLTASEVLTAAQFLERALLHLYDEDDLSEWIEMVNAARGIDGLRPISGTPGPG